MPQNNERETILPLHRRMLVERFLPPERVERASGLVTLPTVRHSVSPARGVIIAVGPSVRSLRPGDWILYGCHAGFKVGTGKNLEIISEGDAFAQADREDLLEGARP